MSQIDPEFWSWIMKDVESKKFFGSNASTSEKDFLSLYHKIICQLGYDDSKINNIFKFNEPKTPKPIKIKVAKRFTKGRRGDLISASIIGEISVLDLRKWLRENLGEDGKAWIFNSEDNILYVRTEEAAVAFKLSFPECF